jgi:hypothetical protein
MLETQQYSIHKVWMTNILLNPSTLVMDRIYFIHGTNVNTALKAATFIVLCRDLLAIFFPNITIQLKA